MAAPRLAVVAGRGPAARTAEESTATLTVPTPVPDGVGKVDIAVQAQTGLGPTSPASLPVQ